VGGTAGTKVTYFAAGAIAAGLIAGALWTLTTEADDEERPPIIVRGGSLIFEGGDANSSDPAEQKGKPWTQVGSDWQPDHPHGIPVTKFTLALRGGNAQLCPALERTRDVAVTYKAPDGTESTFNITTKPRPGSGGKPAPTIVGSGLSPSGTSANPQLTFGISGQGEITHVRFSGISGNVDCPAPITSVKVWQDR
jgi:hypothetical protein